MARKSVTAREDWFTVDVATGQLDSWEASTLGDLDLKERRHLQQWLLADLKRTDRPTGTFGLLESVAGSPEIGETQVTAGRLLVLYEEFAGWELGNERVLDRIDLLLLDTAGTVVVVELKRGADATVELQALRYGAMAERLGPSDLEQIYAKFHGVSVEDARTAIANHVDDATPGEQLSSVSGVRMVVVAEAILPSTATTAMFLQERGIDLRCVELTVRQISEGQLVVAPRLVVPPPTAAALLVRRRREEQAEAATRAGRTRRKRTVQVLIESGALLEGTELRFATGTPGSERGLQLSEWVAEDPNREIAVFTGEAGKSLRWKADDQLYSFSSLAQEILHRATGIKPDAVPGPDYWLKPGSETVVLSVWADELLAGDQPE